MIKMCLRIGLLLFCSFFLSITTAKTLATLSTAPEQDLTALPHPDLTPHLPKKMSLQEAVLIALRNNPDVQNAQLQRILDKYALELAHYNYEPQYSVQATADFTRLTKPVYNTQDSVSLNIPGGTNVNMAVDVTEEGPRSKTLTVTQPLLRGFGSVNLIPLNNAKDQELINRLNFKNSIITIVNNVITAYRAVVQDYNNLEVQKNTLKRQEETFHQFELQLKVGKIPESDLLQQNALLASTRLSTNQAENQLEQDYMSLLNTIGLTPEAKVGVDQMINIEDYKIPTEQEAIQEALAGNPSYQIALIGLRISERGVEQAEDANKWQLNATGTVTSPALGFDKPNVPSLNLQLNVPVLDFALKTQLVDAQVALAQTKISIADQKRDLIQQTINSVIQLRFQKENVKLSENAVKLQRQSLVSEKLKLKYGKSSVVNVNEIDSNLLSEETNLVDTKITYLNDFTQFEALLGITLDRWNIKLIY